MTYRTGPDHEHGDERPGWCSYGVAVTCVEGAALAVVVGDPTSTTTWAIRSLTALALTWAVVASRRCGRGVRAGVGIAFGLLGIALGLAIGVPFALKVPLSPTSISGLLALACGLLTVVTSTRLATAGGRLRRKLLVIPVGLALVVGVLFPLTLAVFVTNVPPLEAGDADPLTRGMGFADARLRTDDGLQLAAWYVPSSNGAAVVLVGGATSVRSDELDHAAVLARHGYGVLLLDSRGHGDSEGDAMLWGWFGDADVRAAVDYLAGRPDVGDGQIAAMGMSMGAEEVIGAAGSDGRIAAVIAEGASARGPRDEGDPASGFGGLVTRYIDWSAIQLADLMTSAHAPTSLRDSVGNASPRPVMVIAAGGQPAEIAAAAAFRDAAPSSVVVWVPPDTGHTKGYATHPAEWESRVIAFLDSALLQQP